MPPKPDTKHGYTAQEAFIKRWNLLGKRGWFHRFRDASDLWGRNGGFVATDGQPADFLCGAHGWLGLVEVKSTKDPQGFKLNLIKKPQWEAATLSRAAGTNYVFAVQREATGDWFWISGDFILAQKGTVLWTELTSFHWPVTQTCPTFAM